MLSFSLLCRPKKPGCWPSSQGLQTVMRYHRLLKINVNVPSGMPSKDGLAVVLLTAGGLQTTKSMS